MSCAEALRRCPQAVFVRPRHSLYREYSRERLGDGARSRARRSSRPGWTRATSTSGRLRPTSSRRGSWPRRCRRQCGRRRASRARSASRRARSSPRSRATPASRAGSSSCRRAARLPSSRRSPCDGCPGVGPKAEERLQAAGVETIGDLAALTDEELRRLLPGSVGTMLRDRARGIDPRELELDTERISISVENTFERDISDRERLHDELRGMATEVADALQRSGQVARTVTTKLRYADFSIRSRSTSLSTGIDTAETIGDLACQPARPGPARPAGRAPPRRRRRLRARRLPPARARDGLTAGLTLTQLRHTASWRG